MYERYRVIEEFYLTDNHFFNYVRFTVNSRWRMVAETTVGTVQMNRENVTVNVPKELFEKHFKELTK